MAGATSTQPQLVLGTAGHIDHGKTALVRALTGVDCDRLPEEKARGITIELGFAPLDLGGVRVSVVDVPGHEGLVRTMVSGATGIDLVLLVVAADEGAMPQTREHLAICELLGLSRGVVALTKCDLVETEMAELAAEEVRALLAPTPLSALPIVRVSARTGEGLDDLRNALAAEISAAPARTPRDGPPRLAIDRAFEVRGFGPVATGTLIGSALAVGDLLELHPSGLRGRVRGLESHGVRRERAEPGARTAVNVQGIPLDALARGCLLAPPGALAPTVVLDVELRWLGEAPLEELASVELLSGTAERRARIGPIGAPIPVGGSGLARIHVDGDPLVLLPGDRFIVRGFARGAQSGATQGGGRVLDVAPPRRRRSDPALAAELESLRRGDAAGGLCVRILRAGLAGIAREELARATGLLPASLERELAALAAKGMIACAPGGLCVAEAALRDLESRLCAALDAFHEAEPLRPGMPTAALRGALPANAPRELAELALARLAAQVELVQEGEHARRPAHRAALSDAQQRIAATLCAELAAAALEPPSLRDLAAKTGAAPQPLVDLLAHLEREGRVVRAPGDLWFDAGAIESLRARIREHFVREPTLDTARYKALIGTSRRSAVPLMELFDLERLTARRGDVRVLRTTPR
ncbi:MAG TPA: selenocysteine-specific translation elongation factor [Myxococcota bacterium]|nr:selenocysteine-specific translation elongation factor [Myxococcota bacterium]